jgi:hypothetical protein
MFSIPPVAAAMAVVKGTLACVSRPTTNELTKSDSGLTERPVTLAVTSATSSEIGLGVVMIVPFSGLMKVPPDARIRAGPPGIDASVIEKLPLLSVVVLPRVAPFEPSDVLTA